MIFITTDTHFGHTKLMELCNRPENFGNTIINNIKTLNLKKDDIIIHLGDVCLCSTHEEIYWHEVLRQSVPGKLWLTIGNHDRRSIGWYIKHGWDYVANSIIMNIYGVNILFSHHPIYNIPCDINFHGHCHNTVPNKSNYHIVFSPDHKRALIAQEYLSYTPINLSKLIHLFNIVGRKK